MKQDRGRTKIITDTGQKVETTGQMIYLGRNGWSIEVRYKNRKKAWFFDYELEDFPNSK